MMSMRATCQDSIWWGNDGSGSSPVGKRHSIAEVKRPAVPFYVYEFAILRRLYRRTATNELTKIFDGNRSLSISPKPRTH